MEQKTGFANCSSITEFNIGMRVHGVGCGDSQWFEVIAVVNGEAACLRWDGNLDWISHKAIDRFMLDMDSIWFGRRYEYKHWPSVSVKVTSVSVSHIGFCESICESVNACYTRKAFLNHYTPVPIPEVEPANKPNPYGECANFGVSRIENDAKCVSDGHDRCFKAKTTPESWKPEIGKTCRCNGSDATHDVRALWGKFAWICTAGQPEYPGRVVLVSSLRPFTSPVKVNDIVCVTTSCGTEHIGRVVGIQPENSCFLIRYGSHLHGLLWDDDSVITILVPAQEGNKAGLEKAK